MLLRIETVEGGHLFLNSEQNGNVEIGNNVVTMVARETGKLAVGTRDPLGKLHVSGRALSL